MQHEKTKPPHLTHDQTRPTIPFFHAVHGMTDPQTSTAAGSPSGDSGGGAVVAKLGPLKGGCPRS